MQRLFGHLLVRVYLRYDKCGAVLTQRTQRLLNLLLSLCVYGARGLVKQNDGWSLENCTRDRYSLQLSSGKLDAALPNPGLVALLSSV